MVYRTAITFGTFDVFHVGHFNLLKRAKALADQLVVGVSSDEFNYKKKGLYPVYSQQERLEIVGSLKFVSDVFLEESFAAKEGYIKSAKADILVMGEDWTQKFDGFKEICEVVYLPRTKNIATSRIIEALSRDLK